MSKRYDREDKILDRLREENKTLKSENKRLKKQLSTLSRGYYKFLYTETDEEHKEAAIEAKEVAKKICWDCRIGEYKEIIILRRRWRQCQECGKKGKVTIL